MIAWVSPKMAKKQHAFAVGEPRSLCQSWLRRVEDKISETPDEYRACGECRNKAQAKKYRRKLS